MNIVYSYLHDFFCLFFPEICSACNKSLLKSESVICTDCIFHLPYTNFHLDKSNRVAAQLWGRIPFTAAASYLYFQKGLRVQNLMHQFKYNNKPAIGNKLGEMYGLNLKESADFNTVDIIIPVPLHPSKLRLRGYNQSDAFAQGLAEKMEIVFQPDNLIRTRSTETQTKKSRFSRYSNMKEVFQIKDSKKLEGKHILLVDDILTTGATIEACAMELLKVPGTTISIATIAFTN